MKNVKVLGTGCANCRATVQRAEAVARDRGIVIDLEKVEDIREIMKFNVLSTPAVVIDGKVVHAGGIPERDDIEHWLA